MFYKVTNIQYAIEPVDLDCETNAEFEVALAELELPDILFVQAADEFDSLTDVISDKTGWLVESFDSEVFPEVVIRWQAGDVLGLRPDWTEEQAWEWLADNGKHIISRSVELGWEVIEDLLEENPG